MWIWRMCNIATLKCGYDVSLWEMNLVWITSWFPKALLLVLFYFLSILKYFLGHSHNRISNRTNNTRGILRWNMMSTPFTPNHSKSQHARHVLARSLSIVHRSVVTHCPDNPAIQRRTATGAVHDYWHTSIVIVVYYFMSRTSVEFKLMLQ